MHRCLYGGMLLAATICLSPANAAPDAPSKADIDAMRQEIEILKRGQEIIGHDVAEILKILEAIRPPPPVRPIDAVVAPASRVSLALRRHRGGDPASGSRRSTS